MSIFTDFDPLSMNICIFSVFDQKRPFKYSYCYFICWKRVHRRKMLNKMTECIFNALAFLFFLFRTSYVYFHYGGDMIKQERQGVKNTFSHFIDHFAPSHLFSNS